MLTLEVPGLKLFNEQTLKFTIIQAQVLKLEHSLYSIAKWEEKWHIPFIESDNPYLKTKEWEKTEENMLDYIRCMTINKDVDPNVYRCLTQANMVNRFSNKALFFAIPAFISILFAINCCSCSGTSTKLSPNNGFILLTARSLLYFFFDKRI